MMIAALCIGLAWNAKVRGDKEVMRFTAAAALVYILKWVFI